jgi:hypothetical protein
MIIITNIQRTRLPWAVAIAALFLIACSKTDPWKVSHIQTKLTPFRSSRLAYYSEDKINGIDIEFIADSTENHAYLRVHSHPFKPHMGKKNQSQITISDDLHSSQHLCFRHKGGQKLTLTDDAKKVIIERLSLGNDIVIATAGYKVVITAETFEKKFSNFLSPPKSFIKIQSPLQSLK